MSDEQNTKPEAATDPQGRLDALVMRHDVDSERGTCRWPLCLLFGECKCGDPVPA